MGAVEDIKEEDLKGEVVFVEIVFDGRDYLIRFPKALSQIVSKKSSVKLPPISKYEFLLNIV